MSTKSQYKPEIDGIRALSIISVIACHLNLDWASNGYLGVDVFFVVSGFLIIGNIVETFDVIGKPSNVKFNFKNFYFRRARRIIPAAILVQVVVLVYAYFFTNVLVLNSLKQDSIWSAIFLANFHFQQSGTDYFQLGFSPSPLIHYWSLSIEEQFYLIFPITFLMALRYLGRLLDFLRWNRSIEFCLALILSVVTVLSFIYNIHEMQSSSIRGYYSSFGRFWEITSGGILYILSKRFSKNNRIKFNLLMIVSMSCTGIFYFLWLNDLFLVIKQMLIVLLISVYFLLNSRLKHLNWVLSSTPLIFIGKISYSLYLWHWPVILWGGEYSITGINADIVLCCIILFLSAISWKFVEVPFRKIQVPKRWAGSYSD